MQQADYTEPELYTANLDTSKTWRVVWYEMTSPGKWKRARPTGDLNRIAKKEDRLLAGELLRKMVSEALRKGWRYYTKPNENNYTQTGLIAAFDTHVKSKIAAAGSADSARSYKSSVKNFTSWLSKQRFADIDISELNPLHVQQWVDNMIKEKKLASTVNNEVTRVGVVFERMKKLYRLQYNPFKEVDRLTETESNYYENLTAEELTTISTALRSRNPPLRLVMLLVYYAFLRPKTIVQLKANNFDFAQDLITVKGEAHKNRKATVKQILKPLRDALIDAGIDKLPPDHFLFSKNLQPGVTGIHRQRLTEAWNKEVIKGMGINKRLYANKHTGATDYISDNENANLDWLQNQLGHSNLAESAAYVSKARIVKIDEKKTKLKKL